MGVASGGPHFRLHLPQLDFGQKFNGLAMVRGAKYGVREFLYCHGQAGTVKMFTLQTTLPRALPKLAKVKLSAKEKSDILGTTAARLLNIRT
jgi:hypothetical protein